MKNNITHKARDFATQKHEGQVRTDGTPYILHPLKVSGIISVVAPSDDNLIAAAVLHDTLEDTETTYEELVTEFNQDIADLVREVTKIDGAFPNLKTQRGIVLKFADRLHNMSDMSDWTEAERQRYINKSIFWKL